MGTSPALGGFADAQHRLSFAQALVGLCDCYHSGIFGCFIERVANVAVTAKSNKPVDNMIVIVPDGDMSSADTGLQLLADRLTLRTIVDVLTEDAEVEEPDDESHEQSSGSDSQARHTSGPLLANASIPADAQQFLRMCLDWDPTKRATPAELLQCDMFKSLGNSLSGDPTEE